MDDNTLAVENLRDITLTASRLARRMGAEFVLHERLRDQYDNLKDAPLNEPLPIKVRSDG